MDQRDAIKKIIISQFPRLSSDLAFKQTSPQNKNYNCLAWAFGMYMDRWMEHDTTPRFDGVWYWWPDGVEKGPDIDSYIKAYESKGYEMCESYDLEEGYLKIALYYKIENDVKVCVHASRQKMNGIWMSKLGQSFDIEHGTPFHLEGEKYGEVYCCMKISRK